MKRFSPVTTFVLGLIIGALFLGGSLAIADGITVSATTATVTVDGREVSVDAYNIEGSNYFKLRDFTAAVDIGVWYDQAVNTIHIETDKKYDANYAGPDSVIPPATAGYSRTNPAPRDFTQTITVDHYNEKYTVSITLNEVLRGDAAWEKIVEANKYNTPAPEGQEYILANFTVYADDVADDKSVSLSKFDFTPFSSTNAEYSYFSVVMPSPAFGGSIYTGGAHTGYVAFLVDKADAAPKTVYGDDHYGTGGIWFSLK